MKFNLKLFVLVGVLAGFRDVCGTEEENKYDGFIVSEELWKIDGFKAAMDEMRVIKAVYQIGIGGWKVALIDSGFKEQLSYIFVWDGNDGKKVEAESLGDVSGNLCYDMPGNIKYTVYFIFNNGNVVSTRRMFSGCWSLISADFMYFNAENVKDMSDMFKFCNGLHIVFLPSKAAEKKKRCICCGGDEYVCWNNHEVGGLNPNIVKLNEEPKEIIKKNSTKK